MAQTDMDGWEKYTGSNFLKVANVEGDNDAFVVIGIEEFKDDKDNVKPRVQLEKNEIEYLFDLNVTNSNFCKNSGITSPKKLIGKKMFFKKVLVTSPKTKKEVESLRISRIE